MLITERHLNNYVCTTLCYIISVFPLKGSSMVSTPFHFKVYAFTTLLTKHHVPSMHSSTLNIYPGRKTAILLLVRKEIKFLLKDHKNNLHSNLLRKSCICLQEVS